MDEILVLLSEIMIIYIVGYNILHNKEIKKYSLIFFGLEKYELRFV